MLARDPNIATIDIANERAPNSAGPKWRAIKIIVNKDAPNLRTLSINNQNILMPICFFNSSNTAYAWNMLKKLFTVT